MHKFSFFLSTQMQFRPMTIRTTAKSPAFLRASLVLAATSSFLLFFLAFCLFACLVTTNEKYRPMKSVRQTSTLFIPRMQQQQKSQMKSCLTQESNVMNMIC